LAVVKPDPPIGAFPDTLRHNTQLPMPPGACLVLYTDGLVERRDLPVSDGMNQLAESIWCGPADALCTAAIARLLRDQAAEDDIAILAIRRISAVRPVGAAVPGR
jgi:serine phosphatase RsbU (regulator of sigma subunit)